MVASTVIASFWFLLERVMNLLSLPYCMGLTLYRSSWAGFASLAGCSGLGALIVFANAFLAMSLVARRISFRPVVILLVIVWAPFFYGRIYANHPPASDSSIKVTVVQPNWNPGKYLGKGQGYLWEGMSRLIRDAALKTPADLILLPESFGVYLDRKDYLDNLRDLPEVNIIAGGVNYSPDRLLTHNSAYHIRPAQGILSVYNKTGLVPLIENAYAAPRGESVVFSIAGYRFLPLVCFESLVENRVEAQAKDSHGLLLLANEAWFETKTLPFIHLASMVMRSIEYGLPAVMAGNTISMVSDAAGNFKITNYRADEIVTFDFHPGRIDTPFGKYGYAMPYLAGLIVFSVFAARRVRK